MTMVQHKNATKNQTTDYGNSDTIDNSLDHPGVVDLLKNSPNSALVVPPNESDFIKNNTSVIVVDSNKDKICMHTIRLIFCMMKVRK